MQLFHTEEISQVSNHPVEVITISPSISPSRSCVLRKWDLFEPSWDYFRYGRKYWKTLRCVLLYTLDIEYNNTISYGYDSRQLLCMVLSASAYEVAILQM